MSLFVKKHTYKGMPILLPVAEDQQEKLFKVKDHQEFEITTKKHRSAKENATWHAYMTFLFKDTRIGIEFNSLESFKQYVQMSIGAFDIIDVKGKTIYVLWSKKFSEMSHESFHEKIMQPSIDFIFKTWQIDFDDWKYNKDTIA